MVLKFQGVQTVVAGNHHFVQLLAGTDADHPLREPGTQGFGQVGDAGRGILGTNNSPRTSAQTL